MCASTRRPGILIVIRRGLSPPAVHDGGAEAEVAASTSDASLLSEPAGLFLADGRR